MFIVGAVMLVSSLLAFSLTGRLKDPTEVQQGK
jgi:hypothetical protein